MSNILSFFDFNTAALQDPQFERPTSSDPAGDFARFMQDHGFGRPDAVHPDGKLHRFDAPDDRPGQKTSWYVLFSDGVPCGKVGNWRTAEESIWSAKTNLNPAEQMEQDRRIEEARKIRELERENLRREAAKKAQEIWAEAKDSPNHPYLSKKDVPALGVRQSRGNLVIPVTDFQGNLHSLQFITATGEKRFLTGGAVQGHFHVIPGSGKKVYVCEGYATGATIHQATGAKVYVSFNAGNLKSVCSKIEGDIIVAADNDHKTEGNPGVQAAKDAGHRYVVPHGMAGTDFNDLAKEKGMDEVRRQLASGSEYRINIHEWGLDRYAGPAPERRWLVANTIPMGAPTVLAAKGDTGKGMLMLDLALKVGGRPGSVLDPKLALGKEVSTHGTAVILTAEDDKDEMHRRVQQVGYTGHEKVLIIPLPNTGGPAPLVRPGKNGPEAGPFFYELLDQLQQIPDLAMVNIDPLSSFVADDINADPAVGALTMGLFATIGTKTGAAVISCHHLSKTSKNINTHDDARNLVRGSTAIVDNSRCVFVLWTTEDKKAKNVCKALDIVWAPNIVCQGCVVKSNGPADRKIRTFVRNTESGLLEVRDDAIKQVVGSQEDQMLDMLELDIAEAAMSGFPFVQSGTGQSSLYARKNELSVALQDCGRRRLEALAQKLIDARRVKKCRATGSKDTKWLDVPGGDFYEGKGEFAEGARK